MGQFDDKRIWGPTPNYPNVLKQERSETFYRVAGPCFAENYDLLSAVAKELKRCGVEYLRGGTFKAGTYPPNDFGFKLDRLKELSAAGKENGLFVVTEVLDVRTVGTICDYADVLQIGARHMQDYALLDESAKTGKLIFLKRNMGATLDEFLGAAEYILSRGSNVVLVERGSATHANHVRWDLSISTIAAVKRMCNVPIIVDASHGTGRRDLVAPMTFAGIAAGADGFLVETHIRPSESASDADQAISLLKIPQLVAVCNSIRSTVRGSAEVFS